MSVTKAVIPAAGMGTRMLPATKSLPKSMITIVDKPAIQYIVEEAVQSGITDMVIIINPFDHSIQSHFTPSPQLESYLMAHGKETDARMIAGLSRLANISFLIQEQANGLGAALSLARGFTGKEPFAVLYADDIIISKKPVMAQVIEGFEKYSLGCVGIKEVEPENIHRYSSLKVESIGERELRISDMVEKPRPGEAFSMYSVLGRCVLPPEIYDILDNTLPGYGGEVQLTDAMKVLSREKGMIGIDFEGSRFDAGNKLDLLKCAVEVGRHHPIFGDEFNQYLKDLSND